MENDNQRKRAFAKRFVNPILRTVARSSLGPFALLRHGGRKSGKAYEMPPSMWRFLGLLGAHQFVTLVSQPGA